MVSTNGTKLDGRSSDDDHGNHNPGNHDHENAGKVDGGQGDTGQGDAGQDTAESPDYDSTGEADERSFTVEDSVEDSVEESTVEESASEDSASEGSTAEEPTIEDERTVESTSTALTEIRPKVKEPRKKRLSAIDRAVMEFQPDVVELEHGKVPGGARWTLYVAILLIISAIGWAYWAQVDRVVVARGELIPANKPILIQPLQPAKIIELHAKFDDRVVSGQVLVTLDATYSQADVDALRKERIGLIARKARLETELLVRTMEVTPEFVIPEKHADVHDWELERITFDERAAQYHAELRRFEAEHKKVVAQREANEDLIIARQEIIDIQTKQVRTDQKLYDGNAGTLTELQASQEKLISSKFTQDSDRSKRREFVENLNVVETQSKSYVHEWRAAVSELLISTHHELHSNEEELVKANRSLVLSRLEVPFDEGRSVEYRVLQVAELSVGSVASPEQPIYRLMPVNAELELEVEIEGRDVARLRGDSSTRPEPKDIAAVFLSVGPAQSVAALRLVLENVHFGDSVQIKLASLPYQKYGKLEGRLRAISEGTFSEGQGGMERMVYKARIVLTSTDLNNVPDSFRLIPGMSCTAEIKIGKRRVIDYFLYPLIRSLDGSLREP